MDKLNRITVTINNYFLINRYKIINLTAFGILLLSLIFGAGYRAIDIKENFEINGGFEHYVNMASHFWTEPGGYNFEEGLKMAKNPDEYTFTHHPKEPVTSSFENEKGWEFILSLMFKEGQKGMHSLALTVIRYQVMLDLFVIVLLFFVGKSIAGSFGGSLSAILYASFLPSIRMVSWVSYYYWAIPFSALSVFFWTVIYNPERNKYSLKKLILLFFIYGMLIGFAVSVRLNFVYLPIFMSPLIFLRERVFKRSVILLCVMLIGEGLLLLPQIMITQKYYGKFVLSARGKWHHVVSGLGAYPNPFGIRDTGDLTAVKWAIDRGGPDLNKVGIQEYDKFMKKEVLRLIKERPDIFLHNFKNNLTAAATMTPKDATRFTNVPIFLGIIDSDKRYNGPHDPKIIKFAYSFPWLLFFSMIMLYFFKRKCFWALIAVIAHGLYLLGIICLYFPPGDNHATAYFPVYVLLLAIALAIFIKTIIVILWGAVGCLISNRAIKCWPAMAKEYFNKAWNERYDFVGIRQSQISATQKYKQIYTITKWLLIFSVVLFVIAVFLAEKRYEYLSKRKLGDEDFKRISNIFNSGINSSFELWNKGDFLAPDGWEVINNKGGQIHRTMRNDKVKTGVSSVEILTNNSGNCWLYFDVTPDKLYYLIDKTITVSGWVKSDNKTPNKVYISICNGINHLKYPKIYYQNSGDWEKLILTYKIPNDIQMLLILLNVDNGVDSSAYFDDIEILIS